MLPPKQRTWVTATPDVSSFGSLTIVEVVTVHKVTVSVTVTEYDPAPKPEIVGVVSPPGDHK